MSYRPKLVFVIGLLVLVSLALSACNRERPPVTTTTGTPASRGTVAAPATGGTGTQVPAPTTGGAAGGAAESAPTPSAPTAQQVVVTPAAPSASTGGGSTYTVVAGDTLASIAARFGTTSEAIARLNGLTDPNAITLGQQLQIPSGAAATGGAAASATGETRAPAASSGTTTYTVQAGDTLGRIAQRFSTTVAELQRLNNITNPDVLKLGQVLTVPAGGGQSTGAAATTTTQTGSQKSYVVQRGDTLLSIARRFGLTVKQLQDANNITNPDRIYPGQTLVIP